jgi:hypothetical protein
MAPPSSAALALYEAAAAGDLPKFEKHLHSAKEQVETMPLGEPRNRLRHAIIVAGDLERIWRHDGIYWDEESLPDYYDRLAGEYSDFERFITPFRVVDKTGRVFYPRQETRDFLLKKLRPSNPKKRSA